MNEKQKSAKLVLENGTALEGKSFGYIGESVGEICFNTGMTGYLDILTDSEIDSQILFDSISDSQQENLYSDTRIVFPDRAGFVRDLYTTDQDEEPCD